MKDNMKRLLSFMLVAVLGIALSAFTPTKQEIELQACTAWQQGDEITYADGSRYVEWTRVCNGVTERKIVPVKTFTDEQPIEHQLASEQFFTETQAAMKVADAVIIPGEIELTEKYNLYLQVDGGYVPFWVDTKQEKYEVLKLAILKFKGINVDISALSADCGPLHPIVPNDPNTGYTRNCCLPFCDPGCICWTEYCPCGYCVCEPMKDE